jgi:hypothetical protein
MAGRSFRAMHRTADYKRDKALKSCSTEFYHIHGAATYRRMYPAQDASSFFSEEIPIIAWKCLVSMR